MLMIARWYSIKDKEKENIEEKKKEVEKIYSFEITKEMDGLLSDGKYKFIERLGTDGFLGRIYEMKTGYPDCHYMKQVSMYIVNILV